MLQDFEKFLDSHLHQICKELLFDVAILMRVEKDHKSLKVMKLFGDAFARPDLTEGKVLAKPSDIYQNEFALLPDEAQLSNIPIAGLGADCGIRIQGSPFIIVFDDVLSDPELEQDNKDKLLEFKANAENKLNAKS